MLESLRLPKGGAPSGGHRPALAESGQHGQHSHIRIQAHEELMSPPPSHPLGRSPMPRHSEGAPQCVQGAIPQRGPLRQARPY